MLLRAWRSPVSVAVLCTFAVIAIELVVGGRLLGMAISRRALPEWLLAGQLLFDALEWILWLLGTQPVLANGRTAEWFVVGCRTGIFLSNFCLLLFVRTVFRPTSGAALAFALGVGATIATGLSVGVYLGDRMGFASDRIWIWLELGGTEIAMLWCVAESSKHFRRMRKRAALGLSDPVVSNRVLLWCFFAVAGSVSQFFYLLAVAIAGLTGSYPFILDRIMSAATSTGSIMIWLAFFPPPAYLRWVSRTSAPCAD
jgi:hypothetical protein